MAEPAIPTRVVILGGGFGGTYTAMHLQKAMARGENIQVTLIDRDNYFLMTPLLFEAGSGVLEPRHTVTPIRSLLNRAQFMEAEFESVDFDKRIVRARHSPKREPYTVPFDHLVFALGGITNRQIIPGSEHALAFKTLADAIFCRNHIIDLFEQADVETDAARKRRLLTFVVIGAGLVGIELVGELTEFTHNLLRSYRNVNWSDISFHVIEAGSNVLPEMERDLADYAVEILRKRGVRVLTNAPAQKIEPGRVTITPHAGAYSAGERSDPSAAPAAPQTEVIEAETILLCAGVATNPRLADVDIEKTKKGKIEVDATMRSPERPNVWAVGDCANIPGPDGKPYPPLAQHALREAKVLASNIVTAIRNPGAELLRFEYKSLGTLASLGHYKGVGRLLKWKIKGFFAWWVWRSYYLMQMPQWSRRFRIMLDWTIALLFKNDIVKLDLFGEEHPARGRGRN